MFEDMTYEQALETLDVGARYETERVHLELRYRRGLTHEQADDILVRYLTMADDEAENLVHQVMREADR